MKKLGKVIAGVVIAAGASLAVVGGVYAYNRSQVASNESPKAIISAASSSSSSRASSSSDKSLEEARKASSISAENSTSASLSMQAAAKAAEEARLKAEEEARIAAAKAAEEEAARKAQEQKELEEKQRAEAERAAEEARQAKAKADTQAEADTPAETDAPAAQEPANESPQPSAPQQTGSGVVEKGAQAGLALGETRPLPSGGTVTGVQRRSGVTAMATFPDGYTVYGDVADIRITQDPEYGTLHWAQTSTGFWICHDNPALNKVATTSPNITG